MDPRGARARGKRSSATSTPRRRRRIQALAAHAQWFEDRMPWDPRYRKPRSARRDAHARSTSSIETGDSGPLTPIGINLPNDQAIRERYGSKSVSLSNINEAYERVDARGRCATEFSWTTRRKRRAPRSGERSSQRADDRDARGDRPRLGPDGRRRHGCAAPAAARSSTRPSRSRAPISWRCISCRIRSSSSSDSSPPTTTPRSCGPSTSTTRATRCVQLRRVREGHADRRRPHAQPPADRALADGAHDGDRRAAPRRQDAIT